MTFGDGLAEATTGTVAGFGEAETETNGIGVGVTAPEPELAPDPPSEPVPDPPEPPLPPFPPGRVTADESGDHALMRPPTLRAMTLNMYAEPLFSPEITQVVPPLTVQERPPGMLIAR